jgi:hypothetical protein
MFERDLASSLANVAVRKGPRGFTFDDLATAAQGKAATIGRVADWLAEARSVCLVEELGFDSGPDGALQGPRRFRVRTR